MVNLSKDIQCAGSDTRPPMLDRTDFASWQQRIRLYCRGKDNWVNILKSIDKGPYKLGTFRQHKEESINDYYVRFSKLINDMRNIKMTMPKLQLNSKFVNNMLPEWGRFVMAVKLNRRLRESNYDQLFTYLKQHEAHAKENKMVLERLSQPTAQPTADPLGRPNRGQEMNPWGGNAAGYGEAQSRVGNVNQGQARPGQARTVKCYNCNGTGHIARNCTQPKRPQNSEYFKDKMLLMQAQENGVALDAEQLLFLADMDEAPTTQTMFMANLSSADLITDEAGPSYDLYVKDNEVSVVHSNASSVQNDNFMMIYNDMYEPSTPSVSNSSWNAVVKNSLTAELATYREQVELYERRAKFELTEREQKINEQLRLVISDHNFKEETLKGELHSTKLQLASTINRNKSMVEETTFLKRDFKQKENKLLADFLNMKSLKEKVEDKFVKQDQSL
nr:retrovirus-related Pol polyprotein from transposon TNT 1-94 [Tanacetum cinerariifolium]